MRCLGGCEALGRGLIQLGWGAVKLLGGGSAGSRQALGWGSLGRGGCGSRGSGALGWGLGGLRFWGCWRGRSGVCKARGGGGSSVFRVFGVCEALGCRTEGGAEGLGGLEGWGGPWGRVWGG